MSDSCIDFKSLHTSIQQLALEEGEESSVQATGLILEAATRSAEYESRTLHECMHVQLVVPSNNNEKHLRVMFLHSRVWRFVGVLARQL